MSRLPGEKEVTRDVPITTWKDPGGKRTLGSDALCALLIHADHAYVASRFMIWADLRMMDLALFLAAQAVETYLKAFLVDRLGELPTSLAGGKKGHDLVLLTEEAAAAPNSDPLFTDENCRETLRRLTPWSQAGRYPRTGHRGVTGELSQFTDWLDDFSLRVRQSIPYPTGCRDDIRLLRDGAKVTDQTFEVLGGKALRDLFFFQNRAFDGWWRASDGGRIKADGSPW